MAQTNIPSSGGQILRNASLESWLNRRKSTFNPNHKMRQVSKNVCIYKVPEPIRISKPEAYAPLVVSFGPYHHNINPELSGMDLHKLEAVHRMLARLNIEMTILIAEIQKLECKIRECYDEAIDMDGEALSWMLAMDACFIIEFFREKNPDCFSLVFQKGEEYENVLLRYILTDILRVENQIPLFILIKILELECGTCATTKLAAMLSNFSPFRGDPFQFSWDDDAESKLEKLMLNDKRPAYHLLDLYRMVIKDLLTNSSEELATPVEQGWSMNVELSGWLDENKRSTPSAELLDKAGIKFQPGQLRFEKRSFGTSTLYLPRIKIQDATETGLRNLMAYEECQRCSSSREETVISHFVNLLDVLIDSKKDVSIMRKSLVIESFLGSDEKLALMLNSICHAVTFGSFGKFELVMKEAREHYNSRWKVWMSQLKEEHFSNPWYILSLLAAIALLVMTLIQTVYSVKK